MRVLALLFLLGPIAEFGQIDEGVVIVTHPDNVVESLSRRDLQRIYLNKKHHWPNGTRIIPTTVSEETLLAAFLHQFLSKTPAQYSTYWKRMIFSGRGTPPKTFETVEELRAFIQATPRAIGFVSADTDLEGLKVVCVE